MVLKIQEDGKVVEIDDREDFLEVLAVKRRWDKVESRLLLPPGLTNHCPQVPLRQSSLLLCRHGCLQESRQQDWPLTFGSCPGGGTLVTSRLT